jgi:hypothetical protein
MSEGFGAQDPSGRRAHSREHREAVDVISETGKQMGVKVVAKGMDEDRSVKFCVGFDAIRAEEELSVDVSTREVKGRSAENSLAGRVSGIDGAPMTCGHQEEKVTWPCGSQSRARSANTAASWVTQPAHDSPITGDFAVPPPNYSPDFTASVTHRQQRTQTGSNRIRQQRTRSI